MKIIYFNSFYFFHPYPCSYHPRLRLRPRLRPRLRLKLTFFHLLPKFFFFFQHHFFFFRLSALKQTMKTCTFKNTLPNGTCSFLSFGIAFKQVKRCRLARGSPSAFASILRFLGLDSRPRTMDPGC